VKNVGLPHPLVFLNGCQSGRGGVTLTRVGGWAQCFVDAGASAFIGSHWSIGDEAACAFAKAVYAGLLDEGKPIARVVQEARAAIRPLQETTWLAYTLYADPGARVGA
jgi:CHAT domain-containing protein